MGGIDHFPYKYHFHVAVTDDLRVPDGIIQEGQPQVMFTLENDAGHEPFVDWEEKTFNFYTAFDGSATPNYMVTFPCESVLAILDELESDLIQINNVQVSETEQTAEVAPPPKKKEKVKLTVIEGGGNTTERKTGHLRRIK